MKTTKANRACVFYKHIAFVVFKKNIQLSRKNILPHLIKKINILKFESFFLLTKSRAGDIFFSGIKKTVKIV